MVTVSFSGDLTIRSAEAMKHRLQGAIASGNSLVHVDCRAAEAVDLSFVQLILAARKSMTERGGRLRLVAPAAGVLLETLRRGGFVETAGADDLFWIHVEGE